MKRPVCAVDALTASAFLCYRTCSAGLVDLRDFPETFPAFLFLSIHYKEFPFHE